MTDAEKAVAVTADKEAEKQPEASSPAPATAAPPARPATRSWSFDREKRILQVNGKEFKLVISAEDLEKFGQLVTEASRAFASTFQAQASIKELISGFERGEWSNYTNAGQRIKLLHQEAGTIEKELLKAGAVLRSTAAGFGKLFEPAGLYEHFGTDNAEWTKLVKMVLKEVARP